MVSGSVAVETKKEPLRLDLGCGQRPKEGFLGVDIAARRIGDGIFEFDLSTTPWPWADDSVAEAHCSHFLEHLPGPQRIGFMNELHRVLVPGGTATIIVPYYSSTRAVQDWTHAWPPICEQAFLYFNRAWREKEKLDHYPITADFDWSYGHAISGPWQGRSDHARGFAMTHYINVVDDLQVVLTKRGGPEVDKRG